MEACFILLKSEFAILDHYLVLAHQLLQEVWSQRSNTAPGFCITPEEAQLFWNSQYSWASLYHKFLDSPQGQAWSETLRQIQQQSKQSLQNFQNQHVFRPLEYLDQVFELADWERLVLLAVLAPELDPRYPKIYGYLQDNITCKLPKIGWLAELFFPEDGILAFLPTVPIFRYQLVHRIPSEDQIRFNDSLQLDKRILDFFLKSAHPSSITPEFLQTITPQRFSNRLHFLAHSISPRWVWEDLVVPENITQQLREICYRIQFQKKVYEEWKFKEGFEEGVTVLFTGSPGTGKTMAASIIAHELMLDLYKVDLSQIVSKYIGETEKNLEQIFQEAGKSRVLLFFDEADALFGKRSEVKDAHDRYANIEISYLLQRLERYQGLAILATNLPENIDSAFLRRIQEKIFFPFPDETSRRIIWEKAFGSETPRIGDLKLKEFASKFSLSGGHIKNIVLKAAFLAAGENQAIAKRHLLLATQREYEKMGLPFPGIEIP